VCRAFNERFRELTSAYLREVFAAPPGTALFLGASQCAPTTLANISGLPLLIAPPPDLRAGAIIVSSGGASLKNIVASRPDLPPAPPPGTAVEESRSSSRPLPIVAAQSERTGVPTSRPIRHMPVAPLAPPGSVVGQSTGNTAMPTSTSIPKPQPSMAACVLTAEALAGSTLPGTASASGTPENAALPVATATTSPGVVPGAPPPRNAGIPAIALPAHTSTSSSVHVVAKPVLLSSRTSTLSIVNRLTRAATNAISQPEPKQSILKTASGVLLNRLAPSPAAKMTPSSNTTSTMTLIQRPRTGLVTDKAAGTGNLNPSTLLDTPIKAIGNPASSASALLQHVGNSSLSSLRSPELHRNNTSFNIKTEISQCWSPSGREVEVVDVTFITAQVLQPTLLIIVFH
jgi:hypothetical protein